MRAFLLLTIATLPLAACDIQKSSKDDKTVTFNASENGAVAFQVPGVKGKIKLPGAIMAHGDMDIDGVKLLPGSHIGSVRAEDKVVSIGFTSPNSVAEVRDYYAKQFADKGVTATLAGNKFSGTTEDGDAFTLDLVEADGKTAGTILVHNEE